MSMIMKQLSVLTVVLPRLAAALLLQETKVLPCLDNATSVGVTYIPMIDKNRLDPFTNYTQPREVMISLYYPTKSHLSNLFLEQRPKADSGHSTTPYMPPMTAALYDETMLQFGFPTNTFEQLSTLCEQDASLQPRSTAYPLLIFSPGGGAPRFWYSTMLEDLARRGYVVAAVDHPYDALVVEFPDGRATIGLNKTLGRDEVELLVTVRAQDLSFVIDELDRRYPDTINTTDVVALGHSLGGATVAEAALNNSRVKGGVNLDGRLFGSMEKANVTLSKPFLQFASDASSSEPYARWDEEWERLSGWKLEIVFGGAAHSTFVDLPLVAEALGIREKLGEEVKQLLGMVDGVRGLEVTVEYVSAFAEFVLEGRNESLLGSHGDDRFPEVVVKRHI